MQALSMDWALARAAGEELEEYLLSNTLFWQLTPLPGERWMGNLISLTPGNLWISLNKLRSYAWEAEAQEQLDPILAKIDSGIARWRSAWRKKIARELTARLKEWQEYMVDSKTESRLVDYAFKVRRRVILSCFAGSDGELSAAQRLHLLELDERLSILSSESEFIWEPEVARGFPRDGFWFLYRSPLKG